MTNLWKRLRKAQKYLRVIYLFIGQVPNILRWSILLSMLPAASFSSPYR
jgi:hypothetical protein